jgi:hypothetical protein
MNTSKVLYLFIFVLFIFFSCEKDSGPQENTLEVDAVMTEQSTFGWELNDLINSGQDVSALTQSSDMLAQGYNDPFSLEKMKQEGVQLVHDAGTVLAEKSFLAKPLSDSLILFVDDTLAGKRSAIYYDTQSGLATFYEVKYKFKNWRPLVYDSVAAVVDLNFTLDNIADDRLNELYQQQLFKETFFIQKITGQLVVTDYNDTEITGVEAIRDTYYHQNRFLQHLKQSVNLNPDQSGTLREDFEFLDNTTAFRTVTFYPDHSGEFNKQLRDGTQISGTFNSVEDDLQGWYNETIDFPEGRYLDKILKSATVAIVMPEQLFTAEFFEQIFFSTGRIDSIRISLTSQEVNNIRTTTLEVLKANGARGSFTLQQAEDVTNLTGTWTTWNGYYIIVDAEYYFDGSAHIHYEVYAPPYTEGDDPILVADYDISPDGSGSGTITYKDEVYQVTFDGTTQAEISKGGKKVKINLFQ